MWKSNKICHPERNVSRATREAHGVEGPLPTKQRRENGKAFSHCCRYRENSPEAESEVEQSRGPSTPPSQSLRSCLGSAQDDSARFGDEDRTQVFHLHRLQPLRYALHRDDEQHLPASFGAQAWRDRRIRKQVSLRPDGVLRSL